MNKLFVNNIGDLAEAQRASFYRFLYKGINEEILTFPNPFIAKIKIAGKKKLACLVSLYSNELKLKGPNFTIEDCLKRDMTYSIQIYIPGEYYYGVEEHLLPNSENLNSKNQKKVPQIKRIRTKQDIFFGEIPLMTEEGTFVISGCERVIISQIIRSPGVYFRKEFKPSGKTLYTATLISNKGLWTKFYLSPKEKEEEKGQKTPDPENEFTNADLIYIKLSSNFKTKAQKKESNLNSNKLSVYDFMRYFGLSFQEILDSLKYPFYFFKSQYTPIGGQKEDELGILIRQFFFNQKSACFSIGQIGRYKINKKLNLNLPKDITYFTSHDFIGILNGLIELKYYERVSDDIDDIKNKQIRCVGELLQNQIRIGLYRLQKTLIDESSISIVRRLTFDVEASSDPDYWIIDPTSLTSSMKEFFKTSQLSQFMDQINPLAELTHKRRISVFGPNGLKRDHISTVIRDIHPSQYGKLCPIETPEGQNAGLVSSMAMYGRISSLGWIETPYFLIDNQKILFDKSPIFLNPEQESRTIVSFSDVKTTKENLIETNYISAKENYFFLTKPSKAVNFITTSPLQIVSLATSLIPFLEHDDANRALMGSNMQRQAVPLLYTQKPIVGTGLESSCLMDSQMIIKSYCEGYVEFASSDSIIIEDKKKQKIKYFLKKYFGSNQETCINQKPIVWKGENVFSAQIIADGPCTNDGELALGRNLTIAYMPWEGYNYEDAIVINERIILDDCLTSVHIEECETNFTYCISGNEKLTNNLPHLTKYIRRHLTKEGIVKIGSYVKEHDILVGKLTPFEDDETPEKNLLRAIYEIKDPNYRDTSLKVPHGTEGRVIDIRIVSTNFIAKEERFLSSTCELIRIYIAQIRKIQIGDKLAGRHGNKGIISRILSQQDMPYLPDGTPIDILFNPLGVPSRMNVGQVFECLLGFAGEKLGKRYKVTPFDEIYGKESSRVLINQKLKEVAIKKNLSWAFNSSYPGKIFLKDGRTGEYFDNPITVGKSYILKLIHLVEDKIHARPTGPYSMITEQPLAGKSQKGGQRFGEMEVWALEAYGCANTLQELLTIKSDDIDGRNDMYESLLVRKNIEKPNPSLPEAFLALLRELNALGLDFSIKKFEGGFNSQTNVKNIERDIFADLESRLKLRTLLYRKKTEQISKSVNITEDEEKIREEKIKEKKKLLKKLNKMKF
jgi:DNA-directed RNA polymerase subunit beta